MVVADKLNKPPSTKVSIEHDHDELQTISNMA
jgi:hypothetical protein